MLWEPKRAIRSRSIRSGSHVPQAAGDGDDVRLGEAEAEVLGAFGEAFGPALEQVVDELPAFDVRASDGGELGLVVPLHEGGDGFAQGGQYGGTGQAVGGGERGVDERSQGEAEFGGAGAGGAVGVEFGPAGQQAGGGGLAQRAEVLAEQVGGQLPAVGHGQTPTSRLSKARTAVRASTAVAPASTR